MKLSAYIVLTKLMNPDRERGLAEQLQLLLVLVFFRPGIGRRRLRPHPEEAARPHQVRADLPGLPEAALLRRRHEQQAALRGGEEAQVAVEARQGQERLSLEAGRHRRRHSGLGLRSGPPAAGDHGQRPLLSTQQGGKLLSLASDKSLL